MKLGGKVAWVTGASSGIGAALATLLAERGARVVLSARRVDRLEEVRGRCGADRAAVLPMDAADIDSLPGKVREAAAVFGRIDVLINNAGVSQRSLFTETDPAVIRGLLETDLLSPILLTRAVLPLLVGQSSGHIVLISSITGRVATPLRTLYSTSKHGLCGFADSLRAEVWRHGIGVTLVLPGFVRTEASLAALHGDGSRHGVMDPGQQKGISPERCAMAIVRAVERDRREVLVGMGARGGLALALRALAPGLLARGLRRARVT
jgi:short-subunit dehydrogenase